MSRLPPTTAKLNPFLDGLPLFGVTVNVPLQVPALMPLIALPTTLQIFGVETFADSFEPEVLRLYPLAIAANETVLPALTDGAVEPFWDARVT